MPRRYKNCEKIVPRRSTRADDAEVGGIHTHISLSADLSFRHSEEQIVFMYEEAVIHLLFHCAGLVQLLCVECRVECLGISCVQDHWCEKSKTCCWLCCCCLLVGCCNVPLSPLVSAAVPPCLPVSALCCLCSSNVSFDESLCVIRPVSLSPALPSLSLPAGS